MTKFSYIFWRYNLIATLIHGDKKGDDFFSRRSKKSYDVKSWTTAAMSV